MGTHPVASSASSKRRDVAVVMILTHEWLSWYRNNKGIYLSIHTYFACEFVGKIPPSATVARWEDSDEGNVASGVGLCLPAESPKIAPPPFTSTSAEKEDTLNL